MNKQLTTKPRHTTHISEDIQELMDEFFQFVNGDYEKVTLIPIDDIKDLNGLPGAEQIGQALYRLNRCWIHRCMNLGLPGESQRLFKNKVKQKWIQLQKEGVKRQVPKRKRKSASQ